VYRVLRALAMVGVFAEHEGRRFSLTAIGTFLRSDVPGSLRDMAIFQSQGWHLSAWSQMRHSLQTGESGFEKAHGEDPWTWLAAHPEASEVFNRAMTSFSSLAAQAVVAAYDFSHASKIVDVGGGHGMLLATVLQTNPKAQGILFDLPSVVAGAAASLEGSTARARIEIAGGDFFESVPEGGDVYMLKHIVHDWSDEHSTRILSNTARAMVPDARVLLIEVVVPTLNIPHFSKMIDLEMLVMTNGGRERSEAEFAALLAKSGLTLTRVLPTFGPASIIEAKKA
jgi:hypothetical protein